MTIKSVPEATRTKIAITKSSASRKKILSQSKLLGVVQDDPKLAIPGHRVYRHISLEEYKALLASGKTVLQVCEMTSKHLVYFYNALIDGRIDLTKDKFIELYEDGKSLNEIADSYGISRGHMSFLREFYGIKRKGATFQKRLAMEKPLSEEAKSIIIGSMLGDGHITPLGYWSEKHCLKQADYLRWKASFVPEITTDKSLAVYESNDTRPEWKNAQPELCLSTRVHDFTKEIGKTFFIDVDGKRRKIIPVNMCELLNELALSVWFMDDGSTDWHYRRGKKQSSGTKPICVIHTESFILEEIQRLCEILRNKFELQCKESKRFGRKNQWIIKFDTESSGKLMRLIKPHIHSSMLYKIDEEAYINAHKVKYHL